MGRLFIRALVLTSRERAVPERSTAPSGVPRTERNGCYDEKFIVPVRGSELKKTFELGSFAKGIRP